MVERALKGHTEPLKERTLGIEVFGREPDYDTNLDPVVRTTAVEIRKRIAQYYHEPGHEAEIRIDFPPGTYMPEFRMPAQPAVVSPLPEPAAAKPVTRRNPYAIAGGIAALVVVTFLVGRWWAPSSALDRFWAPVIGSGGTVTIYIGQDVPVAPVNTLSDLHQSEQVAFEDATAMARLVALMTGRHQSYRLRLQPMAQVEDLRDGSAVLIGAFNNSWVLQLTRQLRFRFDHNQDSHQSWIEDTQDPGHRRWMHVMSAPYADVKLDYAIVSRLVDPSTGKIVVTAAGLAMFGTEAAGDFLTCEKCMTDFAAAAPPGWDHKNMEILISASVVGRVAGPPHVLATRFW